MPDLPSSIHREYPIYYFNMNGDQVQELMPCQKTQKSLH
jgi:hypothetical protein